MTLFECLQTYLSASATLAAKVPGGFCPGYIPQDGVPPLCVVRYVSGASERPTHDGGPSPWSMLRLELTFWGLDFKTVEQAASTASGLFETPTPIYLGGGGAGLFCPYQIQGPRTVYDEVRRWSGIQIDVIGRLNGDTIS